MTKKRQRRRKKRPRRPQEIIHRKIESRSQRDQRTREQQRINGRVNFYIEKAFSHLNRGDYSSVICYCQKALELDSLKTEAYINLGAAYVREGNYCEAIEKCNRAIELDPKKVEAYTTLGGAYLGKGDHDESIENFNRAIELDPKKVEAYIGIGGAYFAKGCYDETIQNYKRAIELDPTRADAYIMRGFAFYARGANNSDYYRAEDDCDRASQLKTVPTQACLLYSLKGVLSFLKGDQESAIENCKEGIKLASNTTDDISTVVHLTSGNIYHSKGDYCLAIENYNAAIGINPQSGQAYNDRGCVYIAIGKPEEAIDDLNIAIKLENNNPTFYNNRGAAYHEKRCYSEALKDFNDAINMKSDEPAPYLNKGFTYYSMGEGEKAIEAYDNAVRACPNYKTELINIKFQLVYIKDSIEKGIELLGEIIEVYSGSSIAAYYKAVRLLLNCRETHVENRLKDALELKTSENAKVPKALKKSGTSIGSVGSLSHAFVQKHFNKLENKVEQHLSNLNKRKPSSFW